MASSALCVPSGLWDSGNFGMFGVCLLEALHQLGETWACLKIRGTILGVPIIRTNIFLDLYWGPVILGNYHMCIATLSRLHCRRGNGVYVGGLHL